MTRGRSKWSELLMKNQRPFILFAKLFLVFSTLSAGEEILPRSAAIINVKGKAGKVK